MSCAARATTAEHTSVTECWHPEIQAKSAYSVACRARRQRGRGGVGRGALAGAACSLHAAGPGHLDGLL